MKNDTNKFEILRQLALAGARGDQLKQTAQSVLEQTGQLVGLAACSMTLWDADMAVTLAVSTASDQQAATSMAELEDQLFVGLRKNHKLLSAYMSFDTEPPTRSFTLPLRHGQKTFGAVIGVQRGEGSLVSEDIFLEALVAGLTIKVVADGLTEDSESAGDDLDSLRQQAISETAVTVNHEINNPLTAILGNVQLLLMNPEELDDELKKKLGTIEEAALKIRDVTKALLSARSNQTTEYSNGTSMIDLHRSLNGDDKKENEE